MKYNNFERLEMGLFFQELEKDYKLSGTKHWEEGRWECKTPQVRGEFFERTPNGRIASIEFESDEERIYFRKNGRVQWLELCLTGLEERFSFMDGQSTIWKQLRSLRNKIKPEKPYYYPVHYQPCYLHRILYAPVEVLRSPPLRKALPPH